jgi:formylglycine-generating enzyme required for sulfatase activity
MNENERIEIKGVPFRRVSAGRFKMGRLGGDREYAHLNDPVNVQLNKDYWLSVYPVRNRDFKSFIGRNDDYRSPTGSIEVWNWEWQMGSTFDEYIDRGEDYPVVGVNFEDALTFSEWLSDEHFRCRLPTEAEFEYAARAGCGCVHYCEAAASCADRLRQYGAPCPPFSPPVGASKPNRWGFHDMNGLVWQWCSDYFYYQPAEELLIDPTGPSSMPAFSPWKGERWPVGRAIRGGSYAYGVLHSRCANRHYSKEEDRNFNLGFRVVAERI